MGQESLLFFQDSIHASWKICSHGNTRPTTMGSRQIGHSSIVSSYNLDINFTYMNTYISCFYRCTMRLFKKIPVHLPWVVEREVTLYDITRACILPHVAALCLCVVVLYYRGVVVSTTRWLSLVLAGASFVAEPVASTLNLYHNGWGAPDKRFYCHLRAMYRQGHDPLRWVFDACTDASLLLATNGDVFASAALSLAYHMWSRAETNASTSSYQTESQDFAISIEPLHQDQLAVEGEGDPVFVFAGAIIITACLAHGYWLWGLYLAAHAFNTFLYVRRKQSYVQTDLQARVFQLPFRLCIAIFIPV
jgi:hypothetical protein